MTVYSKAERAELADLLDQVGPSAPTLCAGWSTDDLAAHLVARERRPHAAAGLVVPVLSGVAERARLTAKATPYPRLVEQVRSGPPSWSPFGLPGVEGLINTAEYFVHHEDVRRAQPQWSPRHFDAALEETLWKRLRSAGRLLFRRAPVGVVLRRSGDGELVARAGEPKVLVSGPASELLLYAFGRTQVAKVDIDGPADAVARFRQTSLGL